MRRDANHRAGPGPDTTHDPTTTHEVTQLARQVGDVIRHDPAEAPLSVAWAIVLLTLIEVIFMVMFTVGVLFRWNSIQAQQVLTFWLASGFLVLAIILTLYRRFFLDDIVVVKQRKEKWEDLL